MIFQKSQPAGAATLLVVPPSASTGPLKNMDAPSPARKAHAQEIHEKAGELRKGRVLHTSLSRVRHAHGGGFAGSEV